MHWYILGLNYVIHSEYFWNMVLESHNPNGLKARHVSPQVVLCGSTRYLSMYVSQQYNMLGSSARSRPLWRLLKDIGSI